MSILLLGDRHSYKSVGHATSEMLPLPQMGTKLACNETLQEGVPGDAVPWPGLAGVSPASFPPFFPARRRRAEEIPDEKGKDHSATKKENCKALEPSEPQLTFTDQLARIAKQFAVER